MIIRKKVAQSQGTLARSTRCKHTALKWTRRTVDTHIPHQDKRPPNTPNAACIQCKCNRAASCRLQAQPTAHCPTRLRNATATYILPNPATVNLKMPPVRGARRRSHQHPESARYGSTNQEEQEHQQQQCRSWGVRSKFMIIRTKKSHCHRERTPTAHAASTRLSSGRGEQ